MCIEEVNSLLYTVLKLKRKNKLKFSLCSVKMGKIHFASPAPPLLNFFFNPLIAYTYLLELWITELLDY